MFKSKFRQNKPKIFFIGIGGISMSSLAKYLVINGFSVSGSDRVLSETTEYLSQIGCEIFIGHNAKNIENCDVIIYNSAINNDNVELKRAIELKKCVIKRVELLNMILSSFEKSVGFSGCHGKTTATSMFSHILYNSDIGFTSHIGGFDMKLSNLYQSGKEIFATEVCEFDKNINNLTVNIAVVLNIDNDHMNSYKDFNELKYAFFSFLDRATISVVNIDDKNLYEYSINNRFSVTFSMIDKTADYFAKVLYGKDKLTVRFFERGKKLYDIRLNTNCNFNVYNALSAVAVAQIIGVPAKAIIEGLKGFLGVKRRNEVIAVINGCKIVCDYAHHPKEIESILSSYKNEKPLVIFQPHTYSRTKLLFDDFVKVLSTVENLILFKTYPAREDINCGLDEKSLAKELKCRVFDDVFSLVIKIKELSLKNKIILLLGAGDLYDKIKNEIKNA